MSRLLALLLALMAVMTMCVIPVIVADEANEEVNVEDVTRESETVARPQLDGVELDELKSKSEAHVFQAEVNRMMKLIINSLYKNKEIFLRELISNASDALDKIRFLSLTDKSILNTNSDLEIKIKIDKENHALHIEDSGIGMTKDEIIRNLGTIAKSGTSDFLAALDASDDAAGLIGQFGVGFYSSFLVADTVVVTTKSNDDKQYIWVSDSNSFNIVEDTREDAQLGRGTRISLFLKAEAYDFLEHDTVLALIKKYSQFINFPIYMWQSKEETVEVPSDEDDDTDAAADDDDAAASDDDDDDTITDEADDDDDDVEVNDDEDEDDSLKTITETVWDYELVNANKPLWTRNPKDISDDEYNEFYQAFTKETSNPQTHIHFTAEGEVTFRSLLYIPSVASPNMYQDYNNNVQSNIKLFVRRVFITDEFDDFMPRYLSFIHGLVDSDDMPLNVSRETLQQHKLLKVIKKKLIRKALDMIKKLSESEDSEEYKKFFKNFGQNLKLGIIDDYSNRSRLAKLIRYYSSNDESDMTSLEAYVERMKKGQEQIYFLSGQDRKSVETSPFVERLVAKGYEVLYLVDAIDEYALQNLPEFEGHKFQNVAKEGLKMKESEKSKEREEALTTKFSPLTTWISETLSDVVDKVSVSNRLTDSPCALVAPAHGWSGNMERIMKAQAFASSDDPSRSFYSNQKKNFEINPYHPVMKALLERVEAESVDVTIKEMIRVLYETAVMRSGFQIVDSAEYAGRVERMLRIGLDVDVDAEIEQIEDDDDVEEEEGEEDEDNDDDEGEEDMKSSDDIDNIDEDDVEDEETSHDEL